METTIQVDDETALDYVLVAFKIVQPGKEEMFINRLASWLTSATKNPQKKSASHVEIMLKEDSKWFRYSIMKKRGVVRRLNGEESITWTPGKVHKIESNEAVKSLVQTFNVLFSRPTPVKKDKDDFIF